MPSSRGVWLRSCICLCGGLDLCCIFEFNFIYAIPNMNSGNLFSAKCVIVGDGAVGKVRNISRSMKRRLYI